MQILVIIPARAGSKGLPGKNIKILGGKPLIQYAIDCAKESSYNPTIVVDTDSQNIIDLVASCNVHTNLREAHLATDEAPITPVIIKALHHVSTKLDTHFDLVVLLQVTSPFRTAKELDEIIDLFIQNESICSVISVVKMEDSHPARMYTLNNHQQLEPLQQNAEISRRQILADVYLRNGCFYAIRTNTLLAENNIISSQKTAYIMPDTFWVNIDTIRDFRLAELLLPEWQQKNN